MPIDPAVFGGAPALGQANRQCQRCFKPQSSTTPLKSCSRCKRAHYCSKECQVADWKLHKGKCDWNIETKARAKADSESLSQDRSAASYIGDDARPLAKLDPLLALSDVKKWSQAHRSALTIAAIHALRLEDDPMNCMKQALLVTLLPSDMPGRLKVEDAIAAPLDEIGSVQIMGERDKDAIAKQIEDILEQSKKVRSEGAVGFAIAFLLLGPIMNIVPLGIADDPRSAKMTLNPHWLQLFRMMVQG